MTDIINSIENVDTNLQHFTGTAQLNTCTLPDLEVHQRMAPNEGNKINASLTVWFGFCGSRLAVFIFDAEVYSSNCLSSGGW